MSKIELKHPALENVQDIQDICKPLTALNITYFSHVLIDQMGLFSAISNNPYFHEHYLKKKYYNADIHLAKNNELGPYILWDMIDCYGESQNLNNEAEEFGINHTFTITDINENGKNYYHFATNISGKGINQEYLRNIELLKIFISHFREKMDESKILSNAYQIKYSIDEKPQGFQWESLGIITDFERSRSSFLEAIKMSAAHQKEPLSIRNLEILYWLNRKRSVTQIADSLNLHESKVIEQIARLNSKELLNNSFMKKTASFRPNQCLELIHKDTKQKIILSERQSDCLYFLFKGYSAKMIASLLNLSPRTIEHYIEKIRIILNCKNTKELFSFYCSQLTM